jgi:hypothetical protein
MKVASDTGDFVQLEPRWEVGNADLPLFVRVARDGFAAETRTWVERHDWFAFAQALSAMEECRSGEAHIASMSPNELSLTVKVVDRRGHMGIEGSVGKREFDREILLRFSVFAFDSSQIVELARDARRISETLGSRAHPMP